MTYSNLPIEQFKSLQQNMPNELRVNPYLCIYYYEINNENRHLMTLVFVKH